MTQGGIEREDVQAALLARQELGETYDRELVDGFLDRVERAIDARVDARVAERTKDAAEGGGKDQHGVGLALGSIALGIPVTGIMVGLVGAAHLTGITAVLPAVAEWAAIAAINIAYLRRR